MRFSYRLIALLIGASVITGMTYVSVQSQQPLVNEQQQITEPLTWDNIHKLAKEITVLIDSSNSGSGVIIGKKRIFFLNTYYVLTTNSAVEGNNKFNIVTPDGKRYWLNSQAVKKLPGVDLVVLQFNSIQTYRVATLATYDLTIGKNPTLAFVSGWSSAKQGDTKKQSHLFSVGILSTKNRGRLFAMDSVSFPKGYELVYTNVTGVGTKGGPVLDVSGSVIGIHGRVESEVTVDEGGQKHEIQLGYSLGIPIKTFLNKASQTGIDAELLQVKTSPSPHAEKEFTSIYKTAVNSAYKLTEHIEARSFHCLTYGCEKRLAHKETVNQKATKSPVSAIDWLNYGNQMSQMLLPEFALEAYEQAIKLKPNFYPAWYARGLLLLRIKGDNQEAFQSFDKATQFAPAFYPAWRGRGSALSKLERYKEAVKSYDKALQLNPNDLTLQQVRGAVQRELQRNP
ncbi:MAG: tetratricopeptide repeat-containing serine protease family protein [Cyanobacteriota bacterium]